ncbi:MAG: hypothetical protein ABEJ76_05265 [Halanaeroarchaeum sp.]
MLTPLQIVQIVVAALVPASLWIVMSQIRDVKWTRLAPGIVVSVVLGVFLLTSEGILGPLGAAFVTMFLLGHTTTHLDND